MHIVTTVIECVTLQRFTKVFSTWGPTYDYWIVHTLMDRQPGLTDAYGELMTHLNLSDHVDSGRPWDNDLFLAPTEETFLRVAGNQKRIKEAHARQSYRLHAFQQPAEGSENLM